MQTPLQMLIDEFKNRRELGYKLKLTDSDESMIQINIVIKQATELLEKERATIARAFSSGYHTGHYIGPQDYFTKNFTGKND